MTDARRVPGITVSTGGYRVYRVTQPREAWQASQSIRLRGADGAIMLGLVGSLQAKGLAVSQLRWQLSEEQARKLRQDATKQAIAALKGRAEEAAGLLGLRFVQFREVRLDQVQAAPFIQPRLAMASGAAMAPPVAEAEDVPVSASVEADVELRAP